MEQLRTNVPSFRIASRPETTLLLILIQRLLVVLLLSGACGLAAAEVGAAGTALQFNGVTDSVTLPVFALSNPNQFTLEAWIQLCGQCVGSRNFQIINLRKQGVN